MTTRTLRCSLACCSKQTEACEGRAEQCARCAPACERNQEFPIFIRESVHSSLRIGAKRGGGLILIVPCTETSLLSIGLSADSSLVTKTGNICFLLTLQRAHRYSACARTEKHNGHGGHWRQRVGQRQAPALQPWPATHRTARYVRQWRYMYSTTHTHTRTHAHAAGMRF